MTDKLAQHLASLQRDDCYRVDRVLKESPFERTERVFFVGSNGSEMGPFIRKRINREAGLGSAYERIYLRQQSGHRFAHLPKITECYQVGDELTVVMEYVQGETLQDVVYRLDPSPVLAADVFPRLCDAVIELHEGFEQPLIHRDLKPSNIMLSAGNLTIIDFGITRAYDEGARTDTHHFGTRAYAPPEQFGFGQTDVRSDVYALGMLLYFLLTEKTPDAEARASRFASEMTPPSLSAVIEKATALDPADRFGSVRELKGAFAAALGEVPGAAAAGSAPSAADAGREASRTARPFLGFGSGSPAQAAGQTPRGHAPVKPRKPPVRGSRPAKTALGRLLARVPFPLGVAWDVVLMLMAILVVAVCAFSASTPSSAESAAILNAPLWYRWLLYLVTGLLFFVPWLYLVSDRRLFARLVPRLAQVPLWKDVLATCVVIVVGFVLVGVLVTAIQ